MRNNTARPCDASRAIKKWRAGLPVAALWLLFALPAAADFKVTEVQPRFGGGALLLNGTIDLALTTKVEEALSKGIQLDIVIDVRLHRLRWLVWHQGVGSWTLRRRIGYHALSGQYLISTAESGVDVKESHSSVQEALRALGSLNDLRLTLPESTPPEGEYSVEVRASLDIEALPSPLRPVAYTSLAWRLNSGWSLWKLEP
ncbi:MAG: DUF4390 domain-containing protein [Gammaproteobacteria bacterium]|nr:DUF4390 domain-containing protein [Gammaproteobacteria bacterium]